MRVFLAIEGGGIEYLQGKKKGERNRISTRRSEEEEED